MPKVSVIIPAHNAQRFIRETIQSVLGQTYQDFEIVIVNDGSTDGTEAIVEEFVKTRPERIKYIYQKNQGHAICRNTGLKNAQGQYIAFLDADDLWREDKLMRQVSFLDQHPEVGLIHCERVRINEQGETIPTPFVDPKFLSGKIFYHLLLRRAHICTSAVLCRKSVLDEVGYFDETFPDRIGGEDRELWLRIAGRFEIAYSRQPLVKYRYLKGSLSRTRKKELFLRGRFHVIDQGLQRESNCFKKVFLKQLAYSAVHRELIYSELGEDNPKEALRHCLKAIHYFPLNIKLYGQYLKLCFFILNSHKRVD